MTIAERSVKREPDMAVQLATRISPEARGRLDEIVTAEGISIRQVVEGGILDHWARLGVTSGGVANG